MFSFVDYVVKIVREMKEFVEVVVVVDIKVE